MAEHYAGDVSPEDAMAGLTSDKTAVLVDVRTRAEWQFVGVPDLSALGKQPVLLEWQSYPTMSVNPSFADQLRADLERAHVGAETPIFFLCRSGVRSRAAACAATADGFTHCYNIAGGFEGSPDSAGHRGMTEGWKAKGLPWSQS